MKKIFQLAGVLTTIQEPTDDVRELHRRLLESGGGLVIAGDAKGPAAWDLPESYFLSLSAQLESGFSLAHALPTGHYARKNIGYLHAIRSGADCIYETDDDNAPLDSWGPRPEAVSKVRKTESISGCQDFSLSGFSSQWVNVYRYFSNDLNIWPRGLPLNEIHSAPPLTSDLRPPTSDLRSSTSDIRAPIQQGLVNGSPDVDAIWRLTQDRPFEFEPRDSVWLAPGQWCPFNTQSTWWFPVAYPLLYVPSYCSFRMCDIWKSFIAQRCLWAMGFGIVFHAPEVFQQRNEHNLMKDFEDEVPGYLQNPRIAEVLDGLNLSGVPSDDLRSCYKALVKEGFFPDREFMLVDCWLADLGEILKPKNGNAEIFEKDA